MHRMIFSPEQAAFHSMVLRMKKHSKSSSAIQREKEVTEERNVIEILLCWIT